MIVFTVVVYIFDIGFIVYQFIWFSGCTLNIIFLCVTIAFAIIFTVLVAFKTREDSSILTNSFVISYSLFLSWSAMASRPNDSCNPFIKSNANTLYQIGFGLLFTMISLFSISMITKNDDDEGHLPAMSSPLVEKEEDEEELSDIPQIGKDAVTPEEAHVYPISLATILFHVLMIFACAYYGVLLTNWGDASINNDRTDVFKSNSFSFWIKIISQWG